MEFQEKYGRLLVAIDREDLSNDDISFIQPEVSFLFPQSKGDLNNA